MVTQIINLLEQPQGVTSTQKVMIINSLKGLAEVSDKTDKKDNEGK